jgi:undecaprenyl-diphosphatase
MRLVTQYGPYVFVAAFLALWFWPASRSRRTGWQMAAIVVVVGILLALGFNQVIVHLWARPRPLVQDAASLLVSRSADPSFPSDHATFAFAAATGLYLVRRRWGIVAAVFAALVAFSRVYVGTHYPADVIAGAVIGCAFVLLAHHQRRLLAKVAEPFLRQARRVHLA